MFEDDWCKVVLIELEWLLALDSSINTKIDYNSDKRALHQLFL